HGACGTRPYSAWQNGEPPPAEVMRLVECSTIETYVETATDGAKYWEGYNASAVRIETKRGTFEERMPMLKRMTEAELIAKFVENVTPAAGAQAAREIAEMSMRLEE